MKHASLKINRALAQTLIERGLAQEVDGYLVPAISGGDPAADSPFPAVPEDISALGDDELQSFVEASEEAISRVHAAPLEFVSEARGSETLLSEMEAAVDALEAARDELDARAEALEAQEPVDPADPADPAEPADPVEPADPADPAEPAEPSAELAAQMEALAARARPEPEPVVAAATPARPAPPRPARSLASRPAPSEQLVALTAAAGASDLPLGYEFPDEFSLAAAMIQRRAQHGDVPEGFRANETIARADWSSLYPDDRKLGKSESVNEALIASVVDPKAIKVEMARRKRATDQGNALVASGGLCAPVTPYYNLQMVSQADRPVRAALPAFNADRGGIRYAQPASLSSVVGGAGVGGITAVQDQFPGSSAIKTCLVVPCPPFVETDVETIFHCLQFGNLGARTFPERVAQFNNLVLAAQARFAESFILTGIDVASTQVTAGSLGLGASASLFSQVLAAANAQRNRNRMDPEAVLRLILPFWAIDLIVSDVIRGQFQRFDTDQERVIALFRSFNIEPTFHLDGANGRSQVFGTQAAGALLSFPPAITMYLFPEGSFLFVDGGVLELGLVRDSVLNKTNDFQIFGESFENVAYVGVESLAIQATTCDSGVVTGPHAAITCPVNYQATT